MKQNKDKQIREMWNVILALIIAFFALLGMVIVEDNRAYKAEQELQSCQDDFPLAEVINGNLYVGYEDGVRVGFHQDYNGTWYRCARDCEVIEDKSSITFKGTINPNSIDIVNVTLCIGEEPCEVIE